MSPSPVVSSPRASDDLSASGALVVITSVSSASPTTVFTPWATAPAWNWVRINATSVHTAQVDLTFGWGGVAAGQQIPFTLPVKPGFPTIIDFEGVRAALGAIVAWASVASVVNLKVTVETMPP